MGDTRRQLLRHLDLALEAWGPDLPLPPGRPWQPPAPEPAAAAAAPPEPAAAESTSPEPAAAESTSPEPAAATAADPAAALAALEREVAACERCRLCEGRTRTVFGEGSPTARVVFVGEAPGLQEDRTGRPFVGRAGQLLERILNNAMGFQRSEVYIGNINKCRPPDNRDPQPDEVAACLPYLRRQLEILQPEVVVALGRVAAQNLLGTTLSMSRLRGRDLQYQGVPVVPTWHPAYLLRNPAAKRDTWEDIKRVNRLLGRPEVPS